MRHETALKAKKQNPPSAISSLNGVWVVERKDEKKQSPWKKYRERAAEMLKLAKEARSEDARASYIHLAASWDALANGGRSPGN